MRRVCFAVLAVSVISGLVSSVKAERNPFLPPENTCQARVEALETQVKGLEKEIKAIRSEMREIKKGRKTKKNQRDLSPGDLSPGATVTGRKVSENEVNKKFTRPIGFKDGWFPIGRVNGYILVKDQRTGRVLALPVLAFPKGKFSFHSTESP